MPSVALLDFLASGSSNKNCLMAQITNFKKNSNYLFSFPLFGSIIVKLVVTQDIFLLKIFVELPSFAVTLNMPPRGGFITRLSSHCCPQGYWNISNSHVSTVIPRLTKIIRSGINSLAETRLTSRCLERKQPSRVGGSSLCDVVSSFLCHTHTDGKDKLLEWPDRSCLLLYVSARIH